MGNIVRFIVSMSFVLAMGAGLASCKDKIEPGTTQKEPPLFGEPVVVETAREVQWRPVYKAVGTVKAGITSTLGAKLLGSVNEVRVREGDLIGQGQVLATIDPREVEAALERAKASLAQARKALEAALSGEQEAKASESLAHATYRRYLELKKADSVSDQEFDQVKARYLTAKAALKRAQAMVAAARARVREAGAAVSAAQVRRGDAVVEAPFDGVVTVKHVDPGDLVVPGSPLFTLQASGRFRADILLPESKVRHVREGQEVAVEVPALRGARLKGKVLSLVPAGDARSRSFVVKVDLPVTKGLKSGMFATALIPLEPRPAILIPSSAILYSGQLAGVFVLDSHRVVHFRVVRLGRQVEDKMEVISGLKKGEIYVKQMPPGLRDGVRVEVAS